MEKKTWALLSAFVWFAFSFSIFVWILHVMRTKPEEAAATNIKTAMGFALVFLGFLGISAIAMYVFCPSCSVPFMALGKPTPDLLLKWCPGGAKSTT